MYITGNLLKIVIRIHQERFVTPLVKMASAVMLPVEMGGVGNIEVAHEFPSVNKLFQNQRPLSSET